MFHRKNQRIWAFGWFGCALAILFVFQARQPGSAAQITATPVVTTSRTLAVQFLPTNTPRPTRTPTAGQPVAPVEGRLCYDCNRLRLRNSPGTAGEILAMLDEGVVFQIVGRTEDAAWIEITLADGRRGWIAAAYARHPDTGALEPGRISGLPVTGLAVEASPTPTSEYLASVPGWLTGITSNARQIYLRGQGMGNRANVFSKVGDSITASANFLYPFGQGQYDLGQYGGLGGVVSYYVQANARAGNSFANTSLAAGGGWTADKLLTPGYAFPDVCGSDTPLVCEYKSVRPAVALIMLGTNDSGSGATDVFAFQLGEIVRISIEMGVVPVLSTIPPKNIDENQESRVNAFNEVIRQTARQYDVPLWDYYANMINLPNRGMSSDGLHPSAPPDGAAGRFSADNLQYGFTLRNLNALQVLDSLWRFVMY